MSTRQSPGNGHIEPATAQRALLSGLLPQQEANQQAPTKIQVRGLNVFYSAHQVLTAIDLDLRECQVTALIGPSGSGKTTFLRTLNRMNDIIPGARATGQVMLGGRNVLDPTLDVVTLRRQVGMVFQRPNPFPMSIGDNIGYALRVHGMKRPEITERVERSLREAALWDDVKDKLQKSAYDLSGGQQQRLCIARAIALRPAVLLMDEPTSALDPIGSLKIEELLTELKRDYTIVIVTHNLQQAARVAEYVGVFLNGRLIEQGTSQQIFLQPRTRETEDFVTGRFG